MCCAGGCVCAWSQPRCSRETHLARLKAKTIPDFSSNARIERREWVDSFDKNVIALSVSVQIVNPGCVDHVDISATVTWTGICPLQGGIGSGPGHRDRSEAGEKEQRAVQ